METESKAIAIVDYGLGNLGSMANMLRKLGLNPVVSKDPAVIAEACAIILPGVGAFDTGMSNLASIGLVSALSKRVLDEEIPLLGVCLGMQLLGLSSEEGRLPGLGWVDGRSVRFEASNASHPLKVPHMGWNTIDPAHSHDILDGLKTGARFYFVHSYHVVCRNDDNVLSRTTYGDAFVSMLARKNIFGVQFHPEKSHKFGMRLLKNFAVIAGCSSPE
jgi:imidazole glycerol-phosphate synthase subunit HisH